MPRSTTGVRRPAAAASLAAYLAVLGLALIWTGLSAPPAPEGAALAVAADDPGTPSPSPVLPSTDGRPSPPPEGEADVRDAVTGPILAESAPVSVSIPAIRVRSRLVDLGLDDRQEMEVPADPAVAGWFTRAPTPGALGPAVIAGHVSWNGAPGVFYRLGTLRRGDEVMVRREDGRTVVFTVTGAARFPKSRFPTRAVYGAIDHAGLRLITCGGSYDRSRHRYPDNVVVFAVLSDVRGED
ncbi:MAG TPA: class F sortase [Microlunatus sp.]|nr:class F sortase [Microlunatus sp.]